MAYCAQQVEICTQQMQLQVAESQKQLAKVVEGVSTSCYSSMYDMVQC